MMVSQGGVNVKYCNGAFERKLFFFVILGTFYQNFGCIVPVIVLYRF
jgi:hypothetical protein